MKAIFVLLAVISWMNASAFAPLPTSGATQARLAPLNVVDAEAVGVARTAFYIWFFGASGGAGIARNSFPRMWTDFRAIQTMENSPTKGGETIGISPICLYPVDLAVKDVEAIVKKPLTVEQIVNKYPVEGNFLSAKGYLTYKAFKAANAKENPLVVRAIFDSLNTNTDVCNPETAQELLDSYKKDPRSLANALLQAKLRGYAAIFGILFLLALADWQAILVHAREGWFPEWPGLEDFPSTLFDPNYGIPALPKYFVADVE
ncbi:hypothetical protein MPSEU_000256200 [Mayamaea pseudoterrestris]|nr:hypothetical protein MPSEU_000256200 [Mayamaea pseudoterrestris]